METPPMVRELAGSGYVIKVFAGDGLDTSNDNVDVEVDFGDGRRFVATFFTIENIRRLIQKYEQTGECKSGLYFWASDMIIVRQLADTVIADTVADMITEQELERAFSQVDSEL
jgi:hypothetical protein